MLSSIVQCRIGLTDKSFTRLQVNLGSFNLNNVDVKAIVKQKDIFNIKSQQ